MSKRNENVSLSEVLGMILIIFSILLITLLLCASYEEITVIKALIYIGIFIVSMVCFTMSFFLIDSGRKKEDKKHRLNKKNKK